MCQREAGFDQSWISTEIEGEVIVTECQVESLKFSVGVTTIKMDTRVLWHEIERFVQNGESLLEPCFLEKTCAHVVVCQPDLDCNIIF